MQEEDTPRPPPAAMPLGEAAARLGLTPDAIRKRLDRGLIRGFKSAGRWYVYLEAGGEPAGELVPVPVPATEPPAELAGLLRLLAERLAPAEPVAPPADYVPALPARPALLARRPWWKRWRDRR